MTSSWTTARRTPHTATATSSSTLGRPRRTVNGRDTVVITGPEAQVAMQASESAGRAVQ
jgi:hypothetical protein